MKKYKTRYRKPTNTNVLNNIITNPKDLKTEYIAKFKDELQNRMKNIHKYDSFEEIGKLFKHSIETASTTLPKKKKKFRKEVGKR